MKWAVEGDHRRHYEEYGFVGFEELVTPEQSEAALDEELTGRDLWRRSEAYKAITASRRIAGLVFELTGVKPVRLAYDQILAEGPLSEKSSVQGLLCGLILHLAGDKRGSGVFVAPDFEFSLEDANSLLVVYARDPAIYVHNPQDPYTGQWKRLGLSYGDRLNEPLFPLLAK